MMRRACAWPAAVALVAALCAGPSRAQATLRFAGEAPRVYTLQPRTHLFAHALQLSGGALPADPFYVGFVAAASYTYHFNELWAWEVLHLGYSFDFDTGLINSLATFGAAVQTEQIDRLRIMLGSHAQLTPLVGKIALINRTFVDAQTHFLCGLGLFVTQGQNGVAGGGVSTAWRPALDLGVGVDLFFSKPLALRLELRDAVVLGAGTVINVMHAAVAIKVHFGALAASAAARRAS